MLTMLLATCTSLFLGTTVAVVAVVAVAVAAEVGEAVAVAFSKPAIGRGEDVIELLESLLTF